MSWIGLTILLVVLGLAVLTLWVRRIELRAMASTLEDLADAKRRGSDRARLQYPNIDLSRCMGCGTCVRACPEEGVLDLVHGQALVVHGARCVGHGACAAECPVDAIALTLGDVAERTDLPAIESSLEAIGSPGIYLAGEVTGYALIRTAIDHGTAVAREIATATSNGFPPRDEDVLDLCVVGAGPAGIACSLEAKLQGLSFVTLEQEELGGTVAKYPRRKLVMTQPVDLPIHGRLKSTSYSKEQLMELWAGITDEHDLPLRAGVGLERIEEIDQHLYRVHHSEGSLLTRNVCLALGRRGTPRKLGVPGEELPKVAYSLIDAQSYQGLHILVVGGGDSAVEAAVGLGKQPGNMVTLSYRKSDFTRIKARNEKRLNESVKEGRVQLLTLSEVVRFGEEYVDLRVDDQPAPVRLPNQAAFIMAGGIPPFRLLQDSGVSFDPKDREEAEVQLERGTGLFPALVCALLVTGGALLWALLFRDYYAATELERAGHELHSWLRPSRGFGLVLGITAAALIAFNLAYIARRSRWIPLQVGSLKRWMTSHVATGILALVLAAMHAGLDPKHSVGGHALACLAVLIVTGAIGRYFYAFVPRAANGNEVALNEARAALASLSGEFENTHREFGLVVREEIRRLVAKGHWQGSFFKRLSMLILGQRELRRTLRELRDRGRAEDLAEEQLATLLQLARKTHRTALMATHFEDLRALLSTWRYLHRWVALLMVLLVAVHIATSLRFAGLVDVGAP